MSRLRSINALLVDIPAGHAALLSRALEGAGWTVRAVPVQGAEALSVALQRRGWEVVLYGGEGPLAVPSRKALALVRLADPHLPFIAVSPHLRRGNLSAVLRGVPDQVPSVPDLSDLHNVLTRELEQARMRRRVGGAHRLLGAQQAIADHLVAGLEPDALCDRVLSTLGESLGWTFGAVWRPDGTQLRCASLWQANGARAAVTELAGATHDRTFAAGQGLPGRVWAFRRPVWVRELPAEAVRAGLVTAAAFPITLGEECVGVIELYAGEVREPNAEVSALFATVGGQLASYLARRRVRARARRSFDGAEALVVALDAHGRVEIANGTACRAFGIEERDLLGRDWFAVAVPEPERAAAREAYTRMLAGEGTGLPPSPGVSEPGGLCGEGPSAHAGHPGCGAVHWRWSLSRDADGTPLGALGWGEPAHYPEAHAPAAAAPADREPGGLRV